MASKIRPHPERERSEPSKDAHAPIHSQQKGLRSLPPLREVIARHGLMARRSLGQNFILDLNVTRRIARAAANDECRPFGGVNVIEVGPGPGGLTRALLETDARRVVAIERDRRALAALQELAAAYPGRLALVVGDALALERVTAAAFGQRRKMLRASLRTLGIAPEPLLEAAGVTPTARAEELSVAEFCALACALNIRF